MRLLIYISFFLIVGAVQAQEFNKIFDVDIDKDIHQSVINDEAETYLSPDGDYLVINSNNDYRVYSLADKKKLISGDHVKKSNKNFKLASSLVGGRAGNMIDNISFSEGSGFWIFEDEGIVLFLDWNLDTNMLKAYDLNSGEMLWKTDEYRYSPGKNKQMATILATIATQQIAYGTMSAGAVIGNGILTSLHNQMTAGNGYGSASARAYIVPVEGTSDFILQAGDSLVCLNIQNGKKRWVYDDYPIMIGDYKKVPGKSEIVLVNFNPSFFAKSENLFFKLDTETGEELLRIEHLAGFLRDRTYIENNRLILDYYGAEVFDLETGERIFITAGEKAMKISTAFPIPAADYVEADPSWIRDGVLYNGYYTMGGKLYPNIGAARKPQFSAWDLQSGEKLWTSQELDKGSTIKAVTEDNLLLTNIGIGNTELISLSRETGEMNHEPVKTKQALLVDNRVNAIFVNDELIVQNGKKGLHYIDRNSLEEIYFTKTKKARVGDPFKFGRNDDRILMFAENGVAFYDWKGEMLFSEKLKNIQSGTWGEDYLAVFTEGNLFSPGELILLDLEDKSSKNYELAAEMLFTPNLKYWIIMKEGQQKLDVYEVN